MALHGLEIRHCEPHRPRRCAPGLVSRRRSAGVRCAAPPDGPPKALPPAAPPRRAAGARTKAGRRMGAETLESKRTFCRVVRLVEYAVTRLGCVERCHLLAGAWVVAPGLVADRAVHLGDDPCHHCCGHDLPAPRPGAPGA